LWFDAGKPFKTTSTDYHSNCQWCHAPAKVADWIYVNGYSVPASLDRRMRSSGKLVSQAGRLKGLL